jgi:lipopolysaccharide transport protein LptA
MNRPFLTATLCLLSSSPWLSAAPGDASPTMNPGSTPAKASSNPFGFGDMGGKERPKGAQTVITAKKEASFDNTENLATFEGSVVVKDPQFTLFCERLVVTLSKDRKGMALTEAFGKVIIVQENKDAKGEVVKSTGRGEKAVYNPNSGDITMTGSPSIQSGINMQIGDTETFMILNRDGKSRTIGPSRTTIVDNSESPPQ